MIARPAAVPRQAAEPVSPPSSPGQPASPELAKGSPEVAKVAKAVDVAESLQSDFSDFRLSQSSLDFQIEAEVDPIDSQAEEAAINEQIQQVENEISEKEKKFSKTSPGCIGMGKKR